MRKNIARMGFLGALLGLVSGQGLTQSPRFDANDVQGNDEGKISYTPFYGHNPIFIPSRSQKVKSKILRANNKRQGRN
jgi:hypothetical protein